jgi:hypothetical protein
MADVNFDDVEGGFGMGQDPSRLPRMVNLLGAVCSVALIAGLAVWGYQLAVRDVNGIPVMKALADPMRVAPVEPGGQAALHQGLSVNAVAAIGTAAPLPELLTLAPRPVDLTEDDVAGLAPVVAEPEADEPAIFLQATATAEAAVEAPLIDMADQTESMVAPDAVAAALAEALGTGPVAASDAAFSDVVAEGLAPATSPRPLRRGSPAEGGTVTAVENVAASAPAAPITEVDPATLAVGTRLVQFGAYDDTTEARAEWVRLVGLFPDLMAGKAMVVQEAQSGGRTFWRLRAHGFEGEDDARRFCAALEAESAACVPVAQR